MYKIERSGNTVSTDAPYYVGRVSCENWLDSIEETYPGEKADLSAETEGRIWMTVSGGSYEDVKRSCQAWCQSETPLYPAETDESATDEIPF